MLGIDRAIALTLLNRAWAMVAGPISLLFIVAQLTPTEQGFYYTITGVLGLQVFFELGLGFVILQTASHLSAPLRVERGRLIGDAVARGRLGRLLADVLRWYALLSIAFIAVVTSAGAWFLGKGQVAEPVAWQAAWFVLAPTFGLVIVVNVVFNFLEGLGLVQDVALARLAQSLLAMVCLWLALAGGLKLMSLAVMHAANLLLATGWIVLRHRGLLGAVLAQRAARGAIDWRHDIWPFQWRIAVSWVAGYLGSQAITPIVFRQLGAVEAGRIGLSLTLMGAASAAAMAWVSTKSPVFGRLAAQREHAALWALFRQAEVRAVAIAFAATAAVLAIVGVLALRQAAIADRFVPLLALALLALATVINVQVSARALYLRAFRREPFMPMSVASGVCVALCTWALAKPWGPDGVAAGYVAVTAVIAWGWCRPVFNQCRVAYAKD